MVQVCQVQGGTDDVRGALREDDVTTVVALVDGVQNVRRVVGLAVVVAFHVAVLVPGRADWQRLGQVLGTDVHLRPGTLMLGDMLGQGVLVLLICRPCWGCNSCEGGQGRGGE